MKESSWINEGCVQTFPWQPFKSASNKSCQQKNLSRIFVRCNRFTFVNCYLSSMLLELAFCSVPFWTFFLEVNSASSNTAEIVEFHEPSYCATDEYFNVNQLKCITCDSEKNLIPSHNGLSCVCNEKSIIKQWNFASFPVCESCNENEIPTRDQLDCIPCSISEESNSSNCEDFKCPSNSILVERTPNGSLLKNAVCQKCNLGLEPSLAQKTCVSCKQTIVSGKKTRCSCPEGTLNIEGLCVRDTLSNFPDEKSTFTIKFEKGLEVVSHFLQENLHRSILFCKMGNQTACHSAANMCVMVMYSDVQKSSPCSLFRDRKRIPTSTSDHIPWIYYGEGEAPTVLSRKRIPIQFNIDRTSPLSYLNITGIIYNADGSLKKVTKIFGHNLQLCPASWKSLGTNFQFASKYHHTCQIPAKQLLASHNTEFIDIFLRYKESNSELLHAIPVLILNVKNEGVYNDKDSDPLQWQFVRRFYLIDKLSGLSSEDAESWEEEKIPKVVRYAKSITLNVKLQGKEEEGKIYVPYLVVEYAEVSREEIEKNELLSLTFRVDYQMDNNLSYVLEVCMGVFSGLAVLWSSIRTWSHSKRIGRFTIDLVTLAHLILFTCGNLANVFFIIVFSASLHYFVFFKGQSVVHVLLPTEHQENVIKLYLIFALLLKIVEVVHLIYNQITIDIFFIDWERPRARNSIFRTNGKNTEVEEEQPVSIWRTYFVANEWNEIQTKRKLNINIHLLLTIFILKVLGIENWATSDPELYNAISPDFLGKEFNFTCRFAVGCLVYLTVYVFQRIFMALIYERYVKNGIQEFVDMCSMANISVFILALENYGFYIHGRSAHGFADTDMQSILNQLQREEEDLVGHRGLLPGTDQQTFEMTVPTQLRAYYKKVMVPLKNMSQTSKRITISSISGRFKKETENVFRSVQAYHNMNRFLAAFLEHALKDLDFEVREKLFTETLLGIEFAEPGEKGVFYSDNGHSFDNVLFYGNEFSLLTFDILLFSFIIAFLEDYLIAGIVTAAFSYFVTAIRNVGGRKNLAKKTLIDERFLI